MDFQDRGFAFVGFEAEEFGDGFGGDIECADDGGFLRGAGAFLLLLHEFFETRHVYRKSAFGAEQFGEVNGKAEGVVEFKGVLAREWGAHAPSRVAGDAHVSCMARVTNKLPTPCPSVIIRLRDELFHDRIENDVIIFLPEIRFTADQAVKILLFPKMLDVVIPQINPALL